MKSSAKIEVAEFRQILIWPLLLFKVDGAGNKERGEPGKLFEEATYELEASKHWTWQGKDAEVLPLASALYKDEQDYSEIVYFHSFVRDFLYGGDGRKANERPMRLFTRSDLASYDVTLKSGETYAHAVERVEFYLFESGIGTLVLELKTPTRVDNKRLTLAEVLDLQNVVRMIFPRRWNSEGTPSETPMRVILKGTNSEVLVDQDYGGKNKRDFTEVVRKRAELPAAKPWQFLLRPLGLYGEAKSSYCFQQIEDQRVPSMAYIAVQDPRDISDWDYVRLTFLDGAGESTVGRYSDEFLQNWQATNAYNRFWQRIPSGGGDKINQAVNEHNADMRTRWLCSGYGFAVVGCKDSETFMGQIQANFHHHYFRMGLIAHFHRASVLMLRDALADATKESDPERKLKSITAVQEQMVTFRSRFWFHEVSTQLQGQEIFKWWSKLLGNKELFDHVSTDIDAAAAFVRTKQEESEKQSASDLSEIATKATAFGLGLAFLGATLSVLSLGFLRVGDPDAELSVWAGVDVVWKALATLCVLVVFAYCLGKLTMAKWPAIKAYLTRKRAD